MLQHANKFFNPGTSPKRVFVSGVKDSGPARNFLIPTFSKRGTLLKDASKYGSKWSRFSGNSPNEKSLGTLCVLLKAGIDFPSKIPTNNFPASSFKYNLSSKSLRTAKSLGKSLIGSVII